MKNIIKIGTRKSKLALIQTDIVKDKIKKAFPEIEVEIVKIDTKGDQILDKSLTSFGGKGVFTAELEAELLSADSRINKKMGLFITYIYTITAATAGDAR